MLTLTLLPSLNLVLQDLQFCFNFMLLIFVLTDANEATYSIEFGSNFSLRQIDLSYQVLSAVLSALRACLVVGTFTQGGFPSARSYYCFMHMCCAGLI